MTSPLWRDEFATRQYAALGINDLVAATSHVDAVIAPYYALVHLFSGVTGLGPGMRIWSVLAFGGAVALLSMLALRWWGRTAAVVTGTMLALNSAVLSQAANARPYALALCAIALATFLLEAALREQPVPGGTGKRVGAWVGYALAGILAVLMQPFAATAIVATVVLIRSRKTLIAWIAASAPWAVTTLLLLWNAGSQGGQIEWVAPVSMDTVTTAIAKAAGMTGRGFPPTAAMVALIALLAVLAVTAAACRRATLFAAALVVMPVVLLVSLSLVVQPVVSWRYLLWISLGVALLTGAIAGAIAGAIVGRVGGSDAGRWRASVRLGGRLIAGVLAIGLVAATGWHTVAGLSAHPSPRDDFPAAVSQIQSDAHVGDLLIVMQRYGQGGVAMGFALSAGDDAFVQEIEAASAEGPREPLAVRVVTSVDPLRTAVWDADPSAAAAADRSLWIVGVSSPRGEDPSTLPTSIAACFGEATDATRIEIPATRLYRIPCG
ncbi:hypothetical protein J2Y69_003201 [Microbacterium resistens]|uniref:Glycosyltransferase RgtA/B/C/D-like domain-containing protein n=1 Tax=Microbacterium resistens TaxID=156977 RepID=A0ABU1SI93_9MICO|nr:hypothetical protein [Microbacterium resistens]MDR6868582.1 hypothetical protein [Microbacterium resistens]